MNKDNNVLMKPQHARNLGDSKKRSSNIIWRQDLLVTGQQLPLMIAIF